MRNAIALLIVIVVALVAYTGYGLFTFEPQRAAPFVFADPVLPPELLAEQQRAAADAIVMTPEQQAQTNAAIAQVSQAVTLYRSYEQGANAQAASTFAFLNTAVLNGQLPAYLLSQGFDINRKRSFELITLDPKNVQSIASPDQKLSCERPGGGAFDILIGDGRNNTLECSAEAAGVHDRVFLGGPGNDTITSTTGNRIISAGTGDDTITVGPGRTIILLDDSWGKDTLTVSCTDAAVMKEEIPANFPVPWVHQYTNFIVLSPRMRLTDVAWSGTVLMNKVTGDTLSVSENCFNLIAAGN